MHRSAIWALSPLAYRLRPPVPLYLLVVQEEPVAQVFSAHSGRPQIEPTLATVLARKSATTPISAPNSRIEWPQRLRRKASQIKRRALAVSRSLLVQCRSVEIQASSFRRPTSHKSRWLGRFCRSRASEFVSDGARDRAPAGFRNHRARLEPLCDPPEQATLKTRTRRDLWFRHR